MQFIHSMRINILTFLVLLLSGLTHAQLTTSSPYSSYGFGESHGSENPGAIGLGMNNISYFDSTYANTANPSSYSRLADGIPLFSTGINNHTSFYTNGQLSTINSIATLDHFAMAFTLKKRYGLAFGLKPFSKRGYEITEKFLLGSDSIEYTYLGNGSVNKVFLGLSANVINRKNTVLSFGGNFSYLFGTITNERRSLLIDANSIDGGIDWNAIRFKSFHYELGAHFEHLFKSNHQLKTSVVIEPGQELNVLKNEYLFYGVAGNPVDYDTLFKSENVRGQLRIPTNLQVGINYNFWFKDTRRNNSIRNSELGLHIGFSSQNWSDFSTTFNTPGKFSNTNRISLGVQYTPERKFNENTASTNFMERVRYRIGYFQGNLPYIDNAGGRLNERGLTVGFGIPILAQNSLSSIQIGCAFAERTSTSPNATNEQYIRFNLGLILAPSAFDKWFRKRKLD